MKSERPSRRALKITELDEEMVRAIAVVNVRHLGRGPRSARNRNPEGGNEVPSRSDESPVGEADAPKA